MAASFAEIIKKHYFAPRSFYDWFCRYFIRIALHRRSIYFCPRAFSPEFFLDKNHINTFILQFYLCLAAYPDYDFNLFWLVNNGEGNGLEREKHKTFASDRRDSDDSSWNLGFYSVKLKL